MNDYQKTISELKASGWEMQTRYHKKLFGRCHYVKKTIMLNALSSIITTVVHEVIHAQEPALPEVVVAALEKVAIGNLTKKEQLKILREFSPELYRALLPFTRR